MRTMTLSDGWSLPDVNVENRQRKQIGLTPLVNHHPITLTILEQLSQDIIQASHIRGESDPIAKLTRTLIRDGWNANLRESLYQSLLSGQSHLILDFGDPVESWEGAPDLSVTPEPLRVYSDLPTLGRLRADATGELSVGLSDPIYPHPGRYLAFSSPFRFNLAAVLDAELAKHDSITRGIQSTISGQGLVMFGLENLYEIMLAGGQKLSQLVTRLTQLKSANSGQGLLAYDQKRETVQVVPKTINREPESLRIIENRISAITGLPSFIIWGHTDGDGYGISSALELYSQRMTALADRCLCANLTFLIEILTQGADVWAESVDLYPEKPAEVAKRFDTVCAALANLQQAGAVNGIEIRNTVASVAAFGLVLDPNPTVITPTTETTANPPIITG